MRNQQDRRWTRNTRRLASAAALTMGFIAQHAGAVTLSPHGIGQALIYPYYTVNKNQDTLISVTNASDAGKAIQVRFREGWNGRDDLSFVLLLGAHDTWTASVSAVDVEGARVRTGDTSCTLPQFAATDGVTNLRTSGYDGSGDLPADGGSQDPRRVREGFLELIVGGDILPGSPTDLAMKRPASGGPPACPNDTAAFVADLDDASSGIFGSASIINVGQGTLFAYNAEALAGLSDDVMFVPGNPYPGPTLAGASTNHGVDGVARAFVELPNGNMLPLDYASGIDAVSAVFAADAIYNDIFVSSTLGAATHWVVAFPTKQFYVDSMYGAVPKAPFAHAFSDGQAPVDMEGTVFDREQRAVAFDTACGEGCPPAMLPHQVNIIGVGGIAEDGSSRVLGSDLLAAFMPVVGDAGHASVHFGTDENPRIMPVGIDAARGAEVHLRGLPVTGFMVYNIVNANAEPGMLANYSAASPHRRTLDCDGTAGCPVHTHP